MTKLAMSQFHHQALQYLKSSSFHLILITHDTSTFYAHDCRKNIWSDKSDPHAPEWKGDGPLLMISDMLMSEWGHLSDGDE